jgi:hypothetical protein
MRIASIDAAGAHVGEADRIEAGGDFGGRLVVETLPERDAEKAVGEDLLQARPSEFDARGRVELLQKEDPARREPLEGAPIEGVALCERNPVGDVKEAITEAPDRGVEPEPDAGVAEGSSASGRLQRDDLLARSPRRGEGSVARADAEEPAPRGPLSVRRNGQLRNRTRMSPLPIVENCRYEPQRANRSKDMGGDYELHAMTG